MKYQLLFEPMGQGLLVHAFPQWVEQAALDHHRDQSEVGWGGQVHFIPLSTHNRVLGYALAVEKQIRGVLQRHGKTVHAVIESPSLAQGDVGVFSQQGHLRQLHLMYSPFELAG
ncbi:hypothetical protein [Limnohabitans sp. Rim8]|uniref:hypothetical protein n=1 Tax=Limnohabitans sp. Rim8 TaxID=1100718 RepID=UPI00345B5426